MNLILLGPPGSGKGTQSSRLAKEFKLAHISTGEILREAVRSKSYLGEKANHYIHTGQLVPDEVMIEIVQERLNALDCKEGFLLDGFPRTIHQAEMLEAFTRIHLVVALKVEEEECVQRLASRKTCPGCGLTYNPVNHPPKKENVCDQCGAVLILRGDDKPETVRERLKVYVKLTAPLIEYYQRTGRLEFVDGTLAPDKILQNLKNMLQSKILLWK